MPDGKTMPVKQDAQRINVNQQYELSDWAKEFDVTPAAVKAAVAVVGDSADRVREILKRRGDQPSSSDG